MLILESLPMTFKEMTFSDLKEFCRLCLLPLDGSYIDCALGDHSELKDTIKMVYNIDVSTICPPPHPKCLSSCMHSSIQFHSIRYDIFCCCHCCFRLDSSERRVLDESVPDVLRHFAGEHNPLCACGWNTKEFITNPAYQEQTTKFGQEKSRQKRTKAAPDRCHSSQWRWNDWNWAKLYVRIG